MPWHPFALLISISVFVVACSTKHDPILNDWEDDDPITPMGIDSQLVGKIRSVTKIVETGEGSLPPKTSDTIIYTFQYDDQLHVDSLVVNTGDKTFAFKYSDEKVVSKRLLDSNGIVQVYDTFMYNSQDQLIGVESYDESGGLVSRYSFSYKNSLPYTAAVFNASLNKTVGYTYTISNQNATRVTYNGTYTDFIYSGESNLLELQDLLVSEIGMSTSRLAILLSKDRISSARPKGVPSQPSSRTDYTFEYEGDRLIKNTVRATPNEFLYTKSTYLYSYYE